MPALWSLCIKDIPNFVTQLNIFKEDNCLKVKSKCERGGKSLCYFPILVNYRFETRTAEMVSNVLEIFKGKKGVFSAVFLYEEQKSFN